MMIDRSEEQGAFRESCRRFAEAEIAPRVAAAEATGKYPIDLRQVAGRMGFLSMSAPRQYGGAEAGLAFQCIATEEFSRVCAGLATGLSNGLGIELIHRIGAPEQIASYYVPTIRGEKSGAFAMSESEAGSDVLAMKTKATRTNDGWRLSGSKMYITGAPFSDYMLVAAYTRPDARARGVSLFLVDSRTPGVEIHKLDKLGHRSMETGAVFFDCTVPDSALLGEEGSGMKYVMAVLERGRITHAARSLGVARACYELAREQAHSRRTFGQAIFNHQAIQFMLSRMLVELTSARLHVQNAVQGYDAGRKVHLEACMAKLVCSEAAVHLADSAMQIFGGQSYLMDSPIQRFFRDARLYPITEGTTEIQLRAIAREASGA